MRQSPGDLMFMSVYHWRDYKTPIKIDDEVPAFPQTTCEQ
jgi:hypothetical protein